MDVTPKTGSGHDDGLDLSPRPAPARRSRNWWGFALVALVLAGLAFVATKALSDASLFFYNADEAVAKQAELGDKRFRLQGTVEGGTIEETGDGVAFLAYYNGVSVPVVHRGDPPELFEEGTPVVLEGHWTDDAGTTELYFTSDRMLVKHDEEYVDVNDERLKEAEEGGRPAASTPEPSTAEP
jgi:cytochrome c-type biogenesis protein CcmE